MTLKPVAFFGDSLDALRAFPESARREAGFQIDKVQHGDEPDDGKPMTTIGAGVKEIRIQDAASALRVIYLAKLADAVYILHAFQKKNANDRAAAHSARPPALQGVDEGARFMSKTQRFASVWEALADTPQEAANLRIRSELMMALQHWVQASGLTQAEAARLCGVTLPRMADLMRGKIDQFSLDALMEMASAAGLEPLVTLRSKKPRTSRKKRAEELVVA